MVTKESLFLISYYKMTVFKLILKNRRKTTVLDLCVCITTKNYESFIIKIIKIGIKLKCICFCVQRIDYVKIFTLYEIFNYRVKILKIITKFAFKNIKI